MILFDIYENTSGFRIPTYGKERYFSAKSRPYPTTNSSGHCKPKTNI
jgi:hypothetical protein